MLTLLLETGECTWIFDDIEQIQIDKNRLEKTGKVKLREKTGQILHKRINRDNASILKPSQFFCRNPLRQIYVNYMLIPNFNHNRVKSVL